VASTVSPGSPGYRSPVFRSFCSVGVGGVLSGFALLLVTGEYPTDGPVLLRVGPGHGVHLGDVFVLAGWAVSMVLLLVLARPHRGPTSGDLQGAYHDHAR
jgi:hypothetical protein